MPAPDGRRQRVLAATGVGRLLSMVVAAGLVAVLFVGLVGLLSVRSLSTTVDDLVARIEPARQTNTLVLQAMTDAETGVRGYALSGDDRSLKPYRIAVQALPGLLEDLRTTVAGDARLEALAARQEEAAAVWLAEYAEPRLELQTGMESFDPQLFALGRERFEAIRAANDDLADELVEQLRGAREAADRRLRTTILLLAVLVSLGALFLVVVGLAARRTIGRPLDDLEETVARLSSGELGARAAVAGPREIRSVARALNELADENERARAVESELAQSLAEAERAKSDFVSNVSHELRTPLTSINGYLELIEDDLDGQMTPELRELFGVVCRNVDRLRELIEDLLTLSRAESRTTDLQTLDLAALVADVVTDLRLIAASRDIVLTVERSAAPIVLADRGQLSRALLNVASNAVKFSHSGSTVTVVVGVEDGSAVVTVADTGIGIPAAEQARLGTRFFRASNAVAREVGGTGLGLRIVQTVLERHDGSMRVDSVEGAGTTVRILLPLYGGDPADA